jgi:hypothetical protein
LDPGVAINSLTPTTSDGFILKLDASGNFVWVKTLATVGNGGGGNATILGVQEDNIGDIYISGNYGGTTDFDPGAGQYNISSLNPAPPFFVVDGFIAKWSNTGNFIWAKSYGGNLEEYPKGIVTTNAREVIVNGTFGGTADFNPDTTVTNNITAQGADAYFLKLDALGNFVWAKSLEGNGGYADITELVMDNAENIFCSGYYAGTTDFDLGPGVNNQTTTNSEIFVIKIDQSGNTADFDILVGPNSEQGKTIAIDNNDNIYSSGYFGSAMDFDPQIGVFNLIPQHDYKWMYTFKWGQCNSPVNTSLNITGCSNTLNGQTYTANGTYYQVFQAANGCDSILTIHVTQSASNTIIDTQACTGSFILNGQTYTTSGNYVQNYTNAFGCDSNYYLSLQVGLSSSSVQNITACDFYVSPLGGFYSTSGSYTESTLNPTGCDSIITLNLIINTSKSITVTTSACDSITINNNTYYTSGTDFAAYAAANGCDSLVQTDFVINTTPTPTTIVDTVCKSYTFNGNTYTSTGTYQSTFATINGCDSIVTLKLKINVVDTLVTVNSNQLIANATNATYQWLNCPEKDIIVGATTATLAPISSGNYAVVITQNGCTDTSDCINYTMLNINNAFNNNIIVSIYPLPINNQLNIKFSKNISSGSISISNMAGQIIYDNTINNSSEKTIDVTALSSGLYFLNCKVDEELKTIKFTKY